MARHRYLASGLAVLGAVCLLPVWALGQEEQPSQEGGRRGGAQRANTYKVSTANLDKSWTAAKTPWGEPNLQGMWSHFNPTPLEGPDPNSETRAAARKAAATRYGPEGQGEYVNGGMAGEGDRKYPTSPRRKSLVVEPEDGRIPLLPGKLVYYNKEARGDSWENHVTWERCMGRGMPGALYRGGYGNGFQLFQSPGWVVIYAEMIHEIRVIPTDGRPHMSKDSHFWNGDPVGHWEGNTLVVDTTNYNNKGQITSEAAASVYQTEALHVVERFTRVDPTTINYEVTVEDPNTFSRPWKIQMPQNLDPGYVIYEYACHEGNRNYMEGSLRQGRFRDQLAAEEAAKKGTSQK